MVIPSWGFILKVTWESVQRAGSVWYRVNTQEVRVLIYCPTPNTPLNPSASVRLRIHPGEWVYFRPSLEVLQFLGRTESPTHCWVILVLWVLPIRRAGTTREIVSPGLGSLGWVRFRIPGGLGLPFREVGMREGRKRGRETRHCPLVPCRGPGT